MITFVYSVINSISNKQQVFSHTGAQRFPFINEIVAWSIILRMLFEDLYMSTEHTISENIMSKYISEWIKTLLQ